MTTWKQTCLCSSKALYTHQSVGQIWFVGYSLLSPSMENKNYPESCNQNVDISVYFPPTHIALRGYDYILYITSVVP